MPSDQIRVILENFASVVGIIGIYAIALELLRARKADSREFLFHTYEKFSLLHTERRLVESSEIENLEEFILAFGDKKFDKAFTSIYNFWDLLTRTVNEQTIDKKMALNHFGRVFMQFYSKFSDFNHEFGQITGDTKYWENFDWFAAEFDELSPDNLDAINRGDEYVAEVFAKAAS